MWLRVALNCVFLFSWSVLWVRFAASYPEAMSRLQSAHKCSEVNGRCRLDGDCCESLTCRNRTCTCWDALLGRPCERGKNRTDDDVETNEVTELPVPAGKREHDYAVLLREERAAKGVALSLACFVICLLFVLVCRSIRMRYLSAAALGIPEERHQPQTVQEPRTVASTSTTTVSPLEDPPPCYEAALAIEDLPPPDYKTLKGLV